ncbi:DNA repair family protein [Lepidopterella palustris CBS 459.81]|uniref:DNA repair family protein n=1 Tax=Lepidopterella palustris CBS 459.81 TaxID=1314670 RepID=A0A8E2E5L5_9PEZI|nr:DNA repair family protein [Lepidopterella palustris CBS 459.81]
MAKKRTLHGFFKPAEAKRPKIEASKETSLHPTYPCPVPHLPLAIIDALAFAPATEGKAIDDQPDLDLLYFQPHIPKAVQKDLFNFLRQELFFYRVQYTIKRGPVDTQVYTPRFTTVFGVDETSCFGADGSLLDSKTQLPIPKDRYQCKPRPVPECLEVLRNITEGTTGETFNSCLVNYYASGNDSISYHSDDEQFLGPNPTIASFSLGAKRDFVLKHKPMPPLMTDSVKPEAKPLKIQLASGDMILMRGPTQANWLHSIPKRKGGESEKGRINITFRKVLVKGGTENYYRYNVGAGGVFRWDGTKQKMDPWTSEISTAV